MEKKAQKLGEILLKQNVITRKQLDAALREHRASKLPLGAVLVRQGAAGERDIAFALSNQLHIPFVSLEAELLQQPSVTKLKNLIPEDYARQNTVLPLKVEGKTLVAVLADPFNIEVLENLRTMTGHTIKSAIATVTDIRNHIDIIYGKRDLLKKAINDSVTTLAAETEADAAYKELPLDQLVASAKAAPIVKLVDIIINQAIESRASDIHLEPFEQYLKLRYRIDGILYEISPPGKQLYPAIISRIKILARMDIAEKRLPQDGSFRVKKADRFIDIRVSTIPTIYGEKIVLRILDKSLVPLQLPQLGFSPAEQKLFEKYINMRMGLILLTGPTGSGKTTTLYAALNQIKSPEKNILTIEDPVEYQMDGINQVEIKPKIGLTFANGMRSFLRQDPDIIMVGEIRDLETAQIAIRASLTGHLVFSTVHTNDSSSAVTRLIDIGLESYLVSSSLIMVVAQRLLRRLCPDCKTAYKPSPDQASQLKLKDQTIYQATGCKKCHQTGYYGQIAIYEILVLSEGIKNLIEENSPVNVIKKTACKEGLRTLRESAFDKVTEGITSIEEALRATMGIN